MKTSTRLVVTGILVATAFLTFYLASQAGDASVRFVEDLERDPAAHEQGTFVLLAVAQATQIPVTGPTGTTMVENRQAPDAITFAQAWGDGENRRYATLVLAMRQNGSVVEYELINRTRAIPTGPVTEEEIVSGTFAAPGATFAATAFEDGDGRTPAVWMLMERPPTEPLQPKPGQFTGRLVDRLPDGTLLPRGVLVYQVDTYTAGCSSKFLPPEERARLESQNLTASAVL